MEVEQVRWPDEEGRLTALRQAGQARLVVVADGVAPPLHADPLEDWIRADAPPADREARLSVLEDRARGAAVAAVPRLDENGLLRLGDEWVSLPPVEHRLMAALLDRFGAVVSRDALARAGWPEGIGGRNVLDVHIVRLRRRLAPLGLVIRTVRSRGYLLETGRLEAATGS